MNEPNDEAVPELKRLLEKYDTTCARCGYNMRGSVGTECPECGLAVNFRTLLGGVSREGSIKKLRWVKRGAWFVTLAVIMPAVLWIAWRILK